MNSRRGRPGRRRLRSITLPVVGGGAGWDTKPDEREVVFDLFADLGGLRVLSWPIEMEGEEYVNHSILNIRNQLSATLKRLPQGSASAPNVRSMRDACNRYLTAVPGPQSHHEMRPRAEKALWDWRQRMYEDVKDLAYGLDLAEAHRLMQEMRKSFA